MDYTPRREGAPQRRSRNEDSMTQPFPITKELLQQLTDHQLKQLMNLLKAEHRRRQTRAPEIEEARTA